VALYNDFSFEVTISPEKIILQKEKEIELYSSTHTLCGVYG